MAEVFTLQLTDGVNSVDFIDVTNHYYNVADGGFDIGLPQMQREFAEIRPGFYIPMIERREYREATIQFDVRGTTRADVISRINAIESILRRAAVRQRLAVGERVQLLYAWEGADAMSYFEVYGGEISYPKDHLSVAKVHALAEEGYMLPDVSLKLYLSANAYGISIYSDTLIELPLYNPSVGSPQTGGVQIQNPGNDPNYHWVEIDATDIDGSEPFITKIVLKSDTPYSAWDGLYMGLQELPFPTKLIFDNYELASAAGGSNTSESNANPDSTQTDYSYRSYTYPQSEPFYSFFSDWGWSLDDDTFGMFYAFFHAWADGLNNFQFAIGVDDYVTWGIRYQEDWVKPISSSDQTIPLGTIQLPPGGVNLSDYGTIDTDLILGLWVAGDTGGSFTLDYVSLLPIGNGMRMWNTRLQLSLTGTLVDDSWRGLAYRLDSSSNISTPFYPLLSPLMLEPNIDQRIYFTSHGDGSAYDDRRRAFKVQVYVVPTFKTMAM